jgi:hypothetical protein
MHWRRGTVVRHLRGWEGADEYAVRLDPPDHALPGEISALSYAAVTGVLASGDRVLLNVSALLRGLGTGGFALVVAPVDRLPEDPATEAGMPAGHIVKARYTPQQQMLLAADEQDSPHHDALVAAQSLDGMPVVVADLHSALPAVVAGIRADAPQARIGYVMTDGAALPLALSRTVAGLLAAGWLATTVTCGQAFGGQLETVSLHSALLACRVVAGADVVVVAQGPGNAGTGTPWGFSGIAVVEALHAAYVLGGRAIASLRVSGADPRDRHRGISHHSRTAYGQALLAPAVVPVPQLPGELGELVRAQAHDLAATARSALTVAPVDLAGLHEALESAPVRLTTMGRGLPEDAAPFLAAAAAGRIAAGMLD